MEIERKNDTKEKVDVYLIFFFSVRRNAYNNYFLTIFSSINLQNILMQGIVCSGMAYYIQGAVMKDRGPVFVTTFNPLCMVIVAIMGSFFLAEIMYLGR